MQPLPCGSERRVWISLLGCVLMLICAACGESRRIPTIHGKIPVVVHVTNTASSTSPLTGGAFPNAARIDGYLMQLEQRGALSGAVLVTQDGMLFSKGYSLADKDARVPNTPQTRFRIGSVTKQFTALAILILQDQGKLHLTDHLCLYIADCPQDWQPITLEHLLTHSSGIPDYTNFPDFVATWTQPTTPEELISRFKDMPLDFPPGSVFRYSNSGYVLLGYIIERISGESYATFLREHIFGPLGMYNTGYDTTNPALPQHATGYYAGYVKPDAYDMSVLYAAGALYSTVEDLDRWDQALMIHKLISQAALNDMFALHIPCPPPGRGGCLMRTDQGYGYGWFLAAEPEGRLIYHVGRIDGFLAFNGFYPGRHLVVVVLSNLEATDVLGIGRRLAEMV